MATWAIDLQLEDQLQHAGSAAPCGVQGTGEGGREERRRAPAFLEKQNSSSLLLKSESYVCGDSSQVSFLGVSPYT